MEAGQIFVGFILFIFGGLSVVRPELYINYQKWVFKNIFGAEYSPSEKTKKIQKLMGVVFILLGLSVFVA